MSLRDSILQALKGSPQEWISGEALSMQLNVSRTAVWKQIKILQADGYAVESSTKKGYRLTHVPDLLSSAEVVPGLRTKLFGCTHYIYFPTIDSTNRKARELAIQGYPEGTVVAAETQTEGRGRRGRSWFSPSHKGLYFSVILRPKIKINDISKIALAASVATADSLENTLQLIPQIRWPNDVLVNNKKMAGILAEVSTDLDSVEYVVLGIGINLNMNRHELRQDFRTPATSALLEQGSPVSRALVLQSLLLDLECRYQQLLTGQFPKILAKAKMLSITLGREVDLDSGFGIIKGHAEDLDEHGFLLVREPSGTLHTIMSGEIIS